MRFLFMKNSPVRFLAVLLLFVSWACAGPTPNALDTTASSASAEPIHIIVLHTNDVHGQVLPRPARWLSESPPPETGGLPRVAAYVERIRRETDESGTGLIVLDAGDWSQGTPEGSIDRGRGFVRALSRIRYDAMTLGNHEFDHGLDALAGLLEEVDLPVTTANVVDSATGRLLDNVAGVIELEVSGMRIGVVGLLSRETPKITHADARNRLEFRDPAETLAAVQAFWSSTIDWWIPITHIGHTTDLKLAEASGAPLVVGGHSHRFLREGLRVGNSLVVQAGCKATVVGRVDMWFEPGTFEVLRSEAQLVDLFEDGDEEFRDAILEAQCAELVAQSAVLMDEVVGELASDLSRSHDAFRSSPAGNLTAEVTRRAVGADVGVMNRGGIRVDLQAGKVTRRHLFEVCPFDNYTVKLEMSGAELFEFLRRSIEDEEHSGLEVCEMTLLVSEPRQLVGLRIKGQDYDPSALYSVALNSFLAGGGDGYLDPEQKATMSPIEDPRLLRELLEELFLAEGRVEVDGSNRFEVVQ